MVDEIVRVVVDQGGAWGLLMALVVIAARSRAGRMISQVMAKHIEYLYFRYIGLSRKEARRRVLQHWDDPDPDPPPTLPGGADDPPDHPPAR